MKKLFITFIIFTFIFSVDSVYAKELVTLSKCVDGDTAWFYLNDEEIKTRFLAIDTPESTNKKEPYGDEASKFTCDTLTNAKKIEIEYDENSDKLDKYDRHLIWVWVDDTLLQANLLKEGLAEIKYLYGDYKYTEMLDKIEEEAKKEKVNIWNEEIKGTPVANNKESIDVNPENQNTYIIVGIILLILLSFTKKGRREIKKIIKKTLK